MEGPRHKHLHQDWQEPLEELGFILLFCVTAATSSIGSREESAAPGVSPVRLQYF